MTAPVKQSPLTVAGIMSGTSADGIDVAIVRIGPRRARSKSALGLELKLDLLDHCSFAFPAGLRSAILKAAGADAVTTSELAQLNWRLGLAYAEAAQSAIKKAAIRVDLVGCHGQTIYHQGKRATALGRRFACTWQIGEPAVIASTLGIPVVANFRPADMARGGHGAPLVPLLDYVYYRHPSQARVLQNLGGIGNLTAVPAAAALEDVFAFDTGPGNMVIDALMQRIYNRCYDASGRVATQGKVLTPVLRDALRSPFFLKAPPKSAGREQFGAAFVDQFHTSCRQVSSKPEDAVATATALTAESILLAFRKYVALSVTHTPVDYLLSGGGAKNATLIKMIDARLAPLGCIVTTTAHTALPVEAKEAAAFALLAYQTWHHRPSNIPRATGADGPAILGQVCYV